MDRDLRLVWLYCVIEDAVRQILGETRLRSRGPTPALTDVEALTIEIFGETLGLNSDASIWRYASDHLRDWFPGLGTWRNREGGGSSPKTERGLKVFSLPPKPIRRSYHGTICWP